MFKKLKDKIAEEVKSSPSRIQQIAQAAQAAVTSASITTSDTISGSEHFFSIAEEDTPQNSPQHQQPPLKSLNNTNLSQPSTTTTVTLNNGAIPTSNRLRRLSNSSLASEVSFRLPTYDSPVAYHLQSDLDISASEIEDVGGPSYNAHLDLISKEQLHQAYKKSSERYQKYRGRYTELARRYRELERDNNKARSVLVETQDKALRRISELREQCSLEQQAKAHLESALRLEMDEMQCVIKTLKTKFELIGHNTDEILLSANANKDNLINLNNIDNEQRNNNTADILINFNEDNKSPTINLDNNNLNDKIQHLEEQLKNYKDLLNEEKCKLIIKCEEINSLTKKYDESQIKIKELKAREEENNILLAENKLMIHSELDNKEAEVKMLKHRLNTYENDLKLSLNEKEMQQEMISTMNQQNGNFNQTIRELQDLNKNLEQKVNNLEQDKRELAANIIISDSEKQTIHKKNEEELKQFKLEYDNLLRKNEELETISENKTKENQSKLESELKLLTEAHTEISQNMNILQLKHNELEKELSQKTTEFNECKNSLEILQNEYDDLKSSYETIEERFKNICNEKQLLQKENTLLNLDNTTQKTEKYSLNQQIASLSEEIKNQRIINENSESEAIKSLQDSMKNSIGLLEERLNNLNSEYNQTRDENKVLQIKLKDNEKEKVDIATDVQTLKSKIESLKSEKRDLEKTLEKEIRDKTELKTQVTNILQEIGRLEEQLKEVKLAHSEIEQEKLLLVAKKDNINTLNQELNNKNVKLQNTIKEFELKLQDIQCENSQLSEKNCLLEENISRLQISLKECEHNFKIENNKTQDLENKISELNLLADTAKDEIEKLILKLNQCLDENSRLFNAKELMEHEFRSLQDQCELIDKEKLCVLDSNKCLEDELKRLRIENDSQQALEREKNNLAATCDKLRDDMEMYSNENETLRKTRNSLQENLTALKMEITAINSSKLMLEQELNTLKSNYGTIEMANQSLSEKNANLTKEMNDLSNKNQNRLIELENLLKRTNDEKQSLKDSIKNATDLEKKLENYEQLKIENEYLNTLVKQIESDLYKNSEEKIKRDQEIIDLNVKLKSQQCELYVLEEKAIKHSELLEKKNLEIEQLRDVCQRAQSMTETLQNELKQQKDLSESLKTSMAELQCKTDNLEKTNEKHQELEQLHKNVENDLAKEKEINHILQSNYNTINHDLSNARKEIIDMKEGLLMAEENCKRLHFEIDSHQTIIKDLNKEIDTQRQTLNKLRNCDSENQLLHKKVNELEIELSEKVNEQSQMQLNHSQTKSDDEVVSQLKYSNEELKLQLAELQRTTNGKILNLNNEIDELLENAKTYKEKQLELDKLRQSNIEFIQEIEQYKKQSENSNSSAEVDTLRSECKDLDTKLRKIMHEVQDVSNRNLFLEQQCENYLILEQSNERLKLQNDKLSRQLDETLVSMQHNDNIGVNTEFEYLRNIMFQYLTNNINSNSNTLVKVIAAVLKFSPQQTQVVLEKESQRNSLVGQINNLL